MNVVTVAEPLQISGATGPNAPFINGVYEPKGVAYNERPLFQKLGDGDKWLRYTLGNRWQVSPTSAKDANNNNGWLESVKLGLKQPTDATEWKVYDGTTKGWSAQPVNVVTA